MEEENLILGVTSYFIGVSIGDAAIHILWSKEHGNSNVKTVRRAIMVDGGGSATFGKPMRQKLTHKFVASAIHDIEDNFICQDNMRQGGSNPNIVRNRLKFDAFVVTHWDHDHYEGVITFIIQDMIASYNNGAGVAQLSRAFYTNGVPKTTFYAPYWRNCFRPSTAYTYPDLRSDMRTSDDDEAEMGINTNMSIFAGGLWHANMLRMRIGKDNLLGRDLFSRTDIPFTPDELQDCDNLQKLMQSYSGLRAYLYPDITNLVQGTPWPGFYCVGVNRYVLGGREALPIALDGHTITPTNMSSICCLLTWHPTEYVSLYTLGDADAELEDEVVRWMGYEEGDQQKVTIAKLSHHGSASSTSENLLPALKPKHIVSMSGGNPVHGHPRWEVMHDLFTLYLFGTDTAECYLAPTPLHLLRYPSYLKNRDQQTDKFYSNVSHMPSVYKRMKLRYQAIRHTFGKQAAWNVSPKLFQQLYLRIRKSSVKQVFGSKNSHNLKHWIALSMKQQVMNEIVFEHFALYSTKKRWTAFTIVGAEDDARNEIVHMYDSIATRQTAGEGPWNRLPEGVLVHRIIPASITTKGTSGQAVANLDSSKSLKQVRRGSASSTSSWEILDLTKRSGGNEEGTEDEFTNMPSDPIAEPLPHMLVAEDWDFSLEDEPTPDPGSYTIVPNGNSFHSFLTQLPACQLKLTSNPGPATSPGETPGSVRVALHPYDDLQWWLQAVLLVGRTGKNKTASVGQSGMKSPTVEPTLATMYLEVSEWPPKTSTTFNLSVLVTMNLDSGLQLSMSVETREASKALDVKQVSVMAMLSKSSTMCLGINLTSTPARWKLSDVADLIQFPYSKAVTFLRDLPLSPVSPTASGRSALWYNPGQAQATTLRLEFELPDDDYDKISKWLQTTRFELGIKKGSVRVIARRNMRFHAGLPDSGKTTQLDLADPVADSHNPAFPGARLSRGSEAIVRGDITFGVGVDLNGFDFNLFVTVSDSSVKLRLQRDAPGQGKESELTQLLRWAARTLGNRDGTTSKDENYENSTWSACETWINAASGFLDAIRPRVIEFILAYDDEGKFQGLGAASITLQVELTLGDAAPKVDKNKLVFFLTFNWGKASGVGFDGWLWHKSLEMEGDEVDYTQALPSWERYLEVKPSDPDSTIDNVDLKKLLRIDSLPAGVPTQITNASISLNAEAMMVEGAVACTYKKDKPSQVPMLILDNLSVCIVRNFEQMSKGIPASWDASLQFKMLLWPGGKEPADDGGFDPKIVPCEITGGLYYTSASAAAAAEANRSAWTLEASIDGLTVSHLAPFWPQGEVRDAVMDMLSHISLEHLGLKYYYGPGDGDGGSKFSFDGVLKLGGLSLSLDFHCDSANRWEFGAKLLIDSGSGDDSKSDGTATIDTVLTELLGKGNVPDIPGEVLKVPVSRPKSKGEVLSFKCGLVKVEGDEKRGQKDSNILMFTASIHISAINLTLVQWRNTSWATTVRSKRIVKVALSDLPEINAPLVGKLKQPFEQLVYMWVSDKGEAKKADPKALPTEKNKTSKTAGVTYAEYQTLETKLLGDDKLYFKADAPDPAKILATDIVIEAGSHFMVVANTPKGETKAVLDYVFGRPKLQPPVGKNAEGGQELVLEGDADAETPNKETSKAPFKKTAGPLSIENVGLTYDAKKNRLGIVLDATFLFGPIGLALLGFSLSVELAKKKDAAPSEWTILGAPMGGVSNDSLMALPLAQDDDAALLGSLPVSNPEVTLEGLMVSFDRPPVTIAGGFTRTKMDGATYYAGGLIVGFVPWKLMAMGVYGQIPKETASTALARKARYGSMRLASSRRNIIELSDDDDVSDFIESTDDDLEPMADAETFTMVFVILKLQGPLFSVGFADISGLTAGVGVNTSIRLPNAETVLDFPFTKPDGTPSPSKGPLTALRALLFPPKNANPWFTPREGALWIAAGLKATAFTMLSADAVLVITTSPSVQVGIFGVAVIDVPSLAASIKFAHAEIGFACVVDPEAGTFRFDAQLSPRSYVLHESCHLAGGMALYAWAKTGEFVLTLGGYHQAFFAPEAYPSPPRLRISWSLSDALRISGEAYFAVTARMCMGGGKLNATLNLGPLSAWFDAFLDFLINFRPFKFAADGGLAVGVRFTLDLWLVTVRIKAEIKAVLSVLGPPMAGRVHVDFWVFGFDIDFGDRDRALCEGAANMLSLDGFRDLVVKGGGSTTKCSPTPMDWVDVGRLGASSEVYDDEDVNANDEKTTEPFLFNCTGGLLPDNDIKAPPAASASSSPPASSWMATMIDDGTVIPENTWAVKAGELEFSITLAFAASAANIFDNRNQRRTAEFAVPIEPAQKNIFALPMRLTGAIESTVKVDIDQDDKHVNLFYALPNERSADRWFVKPVLKNVPSNIWGWYDVANDPALAGNAIASLLNAPRAAGSVSLVMGLTFQPPLPFLSKDKVPKFNIVKDMLQRVEGDGYAFKETESKVSKAWNPMDREEAKLEWKRVVKPWNTESNEKRAEDTVRLWSESMGWKLDADTKLVGSRPMSLLARYEDMVPAAPRIAVAAWCISSLYTD